MYLLFSRKSVIVPRNEQGNVIQIELNQEPSVDLEDAKVNADEEQGIVISLTIKELENIYTSEESKYVENVINNFYRN